MIEDLIAWQEWLRNTLNWFTLTPTPISVILVILGMMLLLRRPRRFFQVQSQGKTKLKDTMGTLELSQWIEHFDRLFVIGINTMIFRHLWNDAGTAENMEPSLLFNLVVTNNTPIPVYITGCEGQAVVDGDTCSLPILLHSSGKVKIDPWTYLTPTLKQRLLTDKGRELIRKIDDGETIQFSLGTVNLLVEDIGGTILNKTVSTGKAFVVDPAGISLDHSGVSKRALTLKNP